MADRHCHCKVVSLAVLFNKLCQCWLIASVNNIDHLENNYLTICSPLLSTNRLFSSFDVLVHPFGQLQSEEPDRKWNKQKESKPNKAATRLWQTCWFRGSVRTQRALCELSSAPYSCGVLTQSHTPTHITIAHTRNHYIDEVDQGYCF